MSRKDVIVISILINIGLLAVLFITAIHHEDVETSQATDFVSQEAKIEIPLTHENPTYIASEIITPIEINDEVDELLQLQIPEFSPAVTVKSVPAETPIKEAENPINEKPVEVIVKKGDSLDKLARIHKSNVEEIRKMNKLQSDRLDIGQVLYIPNTKNKEIAQKTSPVKEKVSETNSAQYYVIKKGDNPWTLARKFNVDFDDLLKLNHLDEEKARNLKVGDKIRVK